MIHLFTILIIGEVFYLKLKNTFLLTILIDLIYVLLYVYNIELFFIKYLIPLVFIFLSFKTNLYTFFKSTIVYYILNFLLGGIVITINISGNSGYLIVFIIYLFLVFLIYLFFKRKEINITYQIEFKFRNKKVKLNAFYDTGCNLVYKGYPVIILNKKYKFDIKTYDYLNYSSGGEVLFEEVYLINNLKIGKSEIKCYCIFLDIDYEAIIGSNLVSL
jgi:hypothetical protein